MWIEFAEWMQCMKILVSHVYAHQGATSAELDINILGDEMTFCIEVILVNPEFLGWDPFI